MSHNCFNTQDLNKTVSEKNTSNADLDLKETNGRSTGRAKKRISHGSVDLRTEHPLETEIKFGFIQ